MARETAAQRKRKQLNAAEEAYEEVRRQLAGQGDQDAWDHLFDAALLSNLRLSSGNGWDFLGSILPRIQRLSALLEQEEKELENAQQ
jgi:hypothetical protein